ncbi:twin-arginine translocation signal domain-containing protein [Roseibium aggregatum]|uniref:Twin-arginine translocation signal domain-containing protein n=1 Tax=Roseibium aggregatum TaxID=187304 RepID=A0A926S8F0_9HYPH|nr:twin-arginine translocation signal domain-containing protein [Roseibium aggregatum]MBD1549430.1 twin-arginine translocation signal domain-containing protein [Roseibium aggregatum]
MPDHQKTPDHRKVAGSHKTRESVSRRGFLTAVGAGGGAAAVMAVAGPASASEADISSATAGGYSETDHVRAYYDAIRM